MLTKRQAEVHRFIFEHTRHNGECPSHAEIRKAIGVTGAASVVQLLAALEERGFIKQIKYAARSIRVLKKPVFHNEVWFNWDDETQTLIPLETS